MAKAGDDVLKRLKCSDCTNLSLSNRLLSVMLITAMVDLFHKFLVAGLDDIS